MEKKIKITITIPESLVYKIITDYVVDTYSTALNIKDASELDWNDYSLMVPSEGLQFTKKTK
jgi:hypothetical protein